MTNQRTTAAESAEANNTTSQPAQPLLPTAPNASGPRATPKAAVRLSAALAACPEPPPSNYGAAVVSWRRIHYRPGAPTRRRAFDTLEEALAFRRQLERPEKGEGEGACLVRIDVMHSIIPRGADRVRWIEYAEDYQRPALWRSGGEA